jgi:thiamine biosynthesis lipoprotein
MSQPLGVADRLSRLLEMGFERAAEAPVTTEALQVDRRTVRVTSERAAMGTRVSITALAPSRARAEEAIGRAFEEMDRLIAIFSRFESRSAISQLNDAGRLDGPPPELERVVARGLRFHQTTRGAFDISVEPVVRLLRERLAGEAPVEPSDAEVRDALALVGSREVACSRGRIRFGKSGMGITLDGIAKGYIVDAIADTLERSGLKRFLVNAGGDIRARGVKEDRRPWAVAVRDPWRDDRYPDAIRLTDGAVATSGSYEVFFDAARRYHHIVDGKTGRSPNASTSVTVLAPTAMAADALATSVFIMAPAEGCRFIESLPRCACLIIDRDGRVFTSRGWRSAAPINPDGTE